MAFKLNVFTGQLDIVGTSGTPVSPSSWKDPVANQAALPMVGNSDGDARVTLDNHHIWVWDSGLVDWIDAGNAFNISYAPSTPSNWSSVPTDVGSALDELAQTSYDTQYRVEKFTLTPADITNKNVTIAQAPITSSKTRMQIIGGLEQDFGTDFTVSSNQISWNGLSLDGVLESGDKIIIIYS